MAEPILTITSRRAPAGGTVTGFAHFWLKYITGFDPSVHCARCFKGAYSKHVRRDMALGRAFPLDEAYGKVLYLCGVSPRWETNLHIPFVPADGETVNVETYNGLRIVIANARQLPAIAPLPDKWRGLPKTYTTCRNFQFGVQHFGAPETIERRPEKQRLF